MLTIFHLTYIELTFPQSKLYIREVWGWKTFYPIY